MTVGYTRNLCERPCLYSRKPRNCGPLAFISVIIRRRAAVRCSTRCTRACCGGARKLSASDGGAGPRCGPHLTSDSRSAIARQISGLGKHQRPLPVQRTQLCGGATRKSRRNAPNACRSNCDCLRVNRPRALAIVAGELARAEDAPPNNLQGGYA